MEHRTHRSICWCASPILALSLYGCGDPEPMTADRYQQADYLFSALEKNVAASEELFDTTVERLIASIDSQDDTIWFGKIDFQSRAIAERQGVPKSIALRIVNYRLQSTFRGALE